MFWSRKKVLGNWRVIFIHNDSLSSLRVICYMPKVVGFDIFSFALASFHFTLFSFRPILRFSFTFFLRNLIDNCKTEMMIHHRQTVSESICIPPVSFSRYSFRHNCFLEMHHFLFSKFLICLIFSWFIF